MYCSSCGQANDDNAPTCVACGAVLQGPAPTTPDAPAAPAAAPLSVSASPAGRPQVPNHLVWAILATLFCCLPGGIVAIIYAAQVDGKVAAGDIAGAEASSRSAVTWCWVSAGAGVVAGVLYFFFIVLASLAQHHH